MITLLAIRFRFHFFLPRQRLISFSESYFHSAVKTDSLLWQLSWRVIMSYWGWKKGGKARTDEENKCSTRTRSINRTPPRGSLTGIVGLFTRKKNPPPFPQPLLPSRAPFFRTRIAPNVSRQLFHCCLCCHFSFREMGLG